MRISKLSKPVMVAWVVRKAWKLAESTPADLERQLSELTPGARNAKDGECAVCRQAVLRYSAKMRGKYCLQRSIATYLLCYSWYGSVPKLVIGARLDPFQAHAWVEEDGNALDTIPVRDTFTILQEI